MSSVHTDAQEVATIFTACILKSTKLFLAFLEASQAEMQDIQKQTPLYSLTTTGIR